MHRPVAECIDGALQNAFFGLAGCLAGFAGRISGMPVAHTDYRCMLAVHAAQKVVVGILVADDEICPKGNGFCGK